MSPRAAHRTLLRLFICGVLIAVGDHSSAQTTPINEQPNQEKLVVIDDEPIVLDVDATGDASKGLAVRVVRVPAEIEQTLGKDPILWAPDEQQASLRSVIPALQSLADITLGGEKSLTAQVVFSYDPEPLLPGKTRELTLRVRAGAQLSPGVYRGNLVSHWQTLRTDGEVKYVWPIVVRVKGLYLLDAHFTALDHATDQPVLRAGDPLSVTARVLAVDSQRGQGALTLFWRRYGDDVSAFAPLFAMPLDDERPLDVALDLPMKKTSLCPRAFGPSEWVDEVVWIESKQASPAEDVGAKVVLHEITAQLPTCARLGTWEAAVAWQVANSDGSLQRQERSTGRIPAVSGIRVHPRFPMATLTATATPIEDVKIQILSLRNLGSEVPLVLQLGGPQSASGAEVLLDDASPKEREPGVWRAVLSEPDEQAAPLAPFVYVLENGAAIKAFHPAEVGEHVVRLHKTASDDAQAELRASRKFDVLWDGSTSMDQDVILFVKEPPIHWGFFHSSREGYGRQVIRTDALKIRGVQGRIEKVHGELKALGRERLGAEYPWEWYVRADDLGDVPVVSFPSQRVAEKFPDLSENEGADGRLAVYQSPDAAAESAGTLATWTEEQCPENQLAVNLGLQLDPDTPMEKERLGPRHFALRMIVSGATLDGRPVHRIHNEVVVVEVKSAWEQYYKPWLIWGSVLVASLVVLWIVQRALRKHSWGKSASESVSLSTDDMAGELFGGQESGVMGADVAIGQGEAGAAATAFGADADARRTTSAPSRDDGLISPVDSETNEYARLPDDFASGPSNE